MSQLQTFCGLSIEQNETGSTPISSSDSANMIHLDGAGEAV